MIYGLSEDFKEAVQVGSEVIRTRRVDFLTGERLGAGGFMLGVPRRPMRGRSEAGILPGVMEGADGSIPLREGDI